MVETGQVPPKGPRPQRNFLRDYDLMLKVMQQDYVDCARYVASGYAEFIGQLYTLNSGMFQSPVYCDHILTQMAMHYLAWYQDPSVRLEVGPGAAWHMAQTYGTQRCGDALYVVWAQEGSPVLVGERIVGVNKKTLEEIRPEVERMLHTTVEPVDHEREDWSLVLAFAKHLTVIGTDGTERTIKVVPGESAVTGRMRRLYAGRGEGPAAVGERGEVCGGTGGRSREACTLSWHGLVAVLTLHDLGAEGFSTLLEEALGELASAAERPRGLVVDVRGATGGVWDEVYPLMPYLLQDGAKATPADAFGVPGVLLNCSRRNVDERLAALDGIWLTRGGRRGSLGGCLFGRARPGGCPDGGADRLEGLRAAGRRDRLLHAGGVCGRGGGAGRGSGGPAHGRRCGMACQGDGSPAGGRPWEGLVGWPCHVRFHRQHLPAGGAAGRGLCADGADGEVPGRLGRRRDAGERGYPPCEAGLDTGAAGARRRA